MDNAGNADNIKALLLDMDGVLYVGKSPIQGAAETVKQLRERNISFRFITNTTTRTPVDLCEKLSAFGISAQPEEIFSAVSATRSFLLSQGTPSCYPLVNDRVKPEFSEFPYSDLPDYVVIGDIGSSWDYKVLNKAFNMLMQGSKLIAMHHNKYWQKEEGLFLDIGAFVAGLEYAADIKATVIGKPSLTFFQQAVDALGFPAKQIAIVGDDIHSDIGGGQGAGLQGILVKTGKYRENLVNQSGIKPEAIINTVKDLLP